MKSIKLIVPLLILTFLAVTFFRQGAGLLEGQAMSDGGARKKAVEFPSYAQWINTGDSYSIEDFRGKVVLLDFWTYCCINCMHVLPDLKRLEQKYPELVVVGVHSAKFNGEQDLDNIREAVLRYDIEHPVINDYKFELWRAYGIRAWPSFVLIDPEGYVVGSANGEGLYDLFDQNIGKLIEKHKDTVRHERMKFELAKFDTPRSVLHFPGKLEVDTRGRRIFISDSNNDRIVIVSPSGEILDVIGSEEGKRDGSFAAARLFRPQGLAYDAGGDVLYIADTENHAIRRADLKTRQLTTIAGTGKQAHGYNPGGVGTGVALNSPWDLAIDGDELRIAMAGPHQLWTLNLKTLDVQAYAGSGRENLQDGPLESAQLAQPSGLSLAPGDVLYFADSETSSVRKVVGKRVETLVGSGLFDFGDRDGKLSGSLLQHALGVCWHEGLLYVADTYNDKVKVIDEAAGTIKTLIGGDGSGSVDGRRDKARLNEPNDIVFLDGLMYVSDTNNGLIRVYDPESEMVSTLRLSNLDKLSNESGSSYMKHLVLDRKTMAAGTGEVVLKVNLPEGFKFNEQAPRYVEVKSSDNKVVMLAGKAETNADFEVRVPVTSSLGESSLQFELAIYYCEETSTERCLIDQVKLDLPLEIREAGDSKVEAQYVIM